VTIYEAPPTYLPYWWNH